MRSDYFGSGVSAASVFEITTASRQEKALPFYIIHAGSYITNEEYLIDRQGNSGYLLFYTLRGQGAIEINNQKIPLPEKHAAIIDCSKPHRYYCDSSDGWDFSWISMNGIGVESLFKLLYPDQIYAVNMRSGNNVERQIADLISTIDISDTKTRISRSLSLHTLICTVLNASLDTKNDISKYKKDIDQVISYIHKNYGEQISLDDMIKNIPVSRYHFIRIFHHVTGSTPYNYLTCYRITMAKKLLSETSNSIAEIAADCGFLDASQFIRHFKKLTGLTPHRYRTEFSAV